MNRMEVVKTEYIDKLKKDLATVETRFNVTVNENAMVGEDHRSSVMRSLEWLNNDSRTIEMLKEVVAQKDITIQEFELRVRVKCEEREQEMMRVEEWIQQSVTLDQQS